MPPDFHTVDKTTRSWRCSLYTFHDHKSWYQHLMVTCWWWDILFLRLSWIITIRIETHLEKDVPDWSEAQNDFSDKKNTWYKCKIVLKVFDNSSYLVSWGVKVQRYRRWSTTKLFTNIQSTSLWPNGKLRTTEPVL